MRVWIFINFFTSEGLFFHRLPQTHLLNPLSYQIAITGFPPNCCLLGNLPTFHMPWPALLWDVLISPSVRKSLRYIHVGIFLVKDNSHWLTLLLNFRSLFWLCNNELLMFSWMCIVVFKWFCFFLKQLVQLGKMQYLLCFLLGSGDPSLPGNLCCILGAYECVYICVYVSFF